MLHLLLFCFSALSCSKLTFQSECLTTSEDSKDHKVLSASAPASTNCLLGNFEVLKDNFHSEMSCKEDLKFVSIGCGLR